MNIQILLRTLFVFLATLQIAFAASQEEIIQAFKNEELVQAEMRRVRAATGGNQEEAQVVSLGVSCGVVGCYFHSLVVMRITRGGTNPQTGTVLATVDGINGKIKKVQLVEITPKQANTKSVKDNLQMLKRYPPPNP